MEALGAGHLLAFNAALFLAVAGPGPAFVLCTQAALTGGFRAGLLTGVGLAVMAGLWTLAALLGLDAFFQAYPAAFTGLQLVGATLIIAFAVVAWRTADAPLAEAAPLSDRRAITQGLLLNLGNPKSILFSAGVLLVIFPPGLPGTAMAVITLNHIALEIAVYAALAALLSRRAVRNRYLEAKPVIARAMALVLAALGARLLLFGGLPGA